MSRRDTFHTWVKQLLILEGWTITHDPYQFSIKPDLSTDLGAERTIAANKGNEKIAVEIKSFLGESQIVDLEKALGQYVIYEELLKRQEPERLLFLAVPRYAYEKVFATEVGQLSIHTFKLRLIVYSLDEGEELLWRTP